MDVRSSFHVVPLMSPRSLINRLILTGRRYLQRGLRKRDDLLPGWTARNFFSITGQSSILFNDQRRACAHRCAYSTLSKRRLFRSTPRIAAPYHLGPAIFESSRVFPSLNDETVETFIVKLHRQWSYTFARFFRDKRRRRKQRKRKDGGGRRNLEVRRAWNEITSGITFDVRAC